MRLFCHCHHDLKALQEQVEKMSQTTAVATREYKALEQDFGELQDKVYRWMQRTLKRDRDAGTVAGASEGAVDGAAPSPPLHPVVARVMARRARRMNGLSAPISGDG